MTGRDAERGWTGVISAIGWLTSHVMKVDSWIILGVIGVSVFFATALPRLEYYDDITSFFPEDNEEVQLFLDVGKRFGGLDIALVGIETDDLFTAANLRLVRELSRKIDQVEGVDSVMSITEMRDFEERQMGQETGSYIQDLVGDLPGEMSAEDLAAIRERVMSREHIVGAMISRDGNSTLLVCRLTPGSNIKKVAESITSSSEKIAGGRRGVRLYYGGAPLISSYIASGAQSDLAKLTPFVLLAVVVVVFLSLKSLPASLLSLLTMGVGLLWTMGAMVLLGKPMTLVSSSLPMILIAIGSAYPIHILTRYFSVLEKSPAGTGRREVVLETIRQTSVPVLMAGLTTFVGFASFLVMDIQPLREFGWITAMGVGITLALSIVLIRAMLSRFDFGRMRIGVQSTRIPALLEKISRMAAYRPVVVLVLFSLVMAGSLFGITRITTQSSTRSYFAKGSPPILADDFLVNEFGGSLFIQLLVEGDVRSPLVLEEMEKLEDWLATLEDVSDIQSPTTVITMANAAMMGRRQIPDTRDQVEPLAFLADDDPAVRLLVARDWDAALAQVRIGGFDLGRADEIARAIEKAMSSGRIATSLVEVDLADVPEGEARADLLGLAISDAARRIDWLMTRRGLKHAPVERIDEAVRAERRAPSFLTDEGFRKRTSERLKLHIVEDELVYMRDEGEWDAMLGRIEESFAAGVLEEQEVYQIMWDFASEKEHELERKALEKRARGEAKGPTGFRKAVQTIHQDLVDIQRAATASDVIALVVEGDAPGAGTTPGRVLQDKVAQHLAFLTTGKVVLPEGAVGGSVPTNARAKFDMKVTGYPLLYKQMNLSVINNQLLSSATALAIIFVLLAGLLRSIRLGVVSMVPAVTTLVVTFGILGAIGEPMDIGISMISIISLGMAVDYAIHFMWKYHGVAGMGFDGALGETMRTTGMAIFANVFEVMFGFAILIAGSLVPIRKSGGLIAETLLLAGIGTLFLMPVFLRIAHPKAYGAAVTDDGNTSGGKR